jgi:hypothetical protein
MARLRRLDPSNLEFAQVLAYGGTTEIINRKIKFQIRVKATDSWSSGCSISNEAVKGKKKALMRNSGFNYGIMMICICWPTVSVST